MTTSLLKLILSGLAFLVGAAVLVVSLLAATTVGSGDRLRSEPLTLGAVQAASLSEGLVPFSQTTVRVEVTADRPITVAAGNPVDVADLLAGVSTAEVTEVEVPGTIAAREVPGEDPLPEGAADLDMWTSSTTESTVAYEYSADEAGQTIAVFDPAGGDLSDVTVQISVDTAGVFGLSLLGVALALILLGLAAYGLLSWWGERPRLPARGPVGSAAGAASREPAVLLHAREGVEFDDESERASSAEPDPGAEAWSAAAEGPGGDGERPHGR